MLTLNARTHKEYVDFVNRHSLTIPARHSWVMQALLLCDLTIVRFMMAFTLDNGTSCLATRRHLFVFRLVYTETENKFRSMLAMVLCGITSIEVWVTKMREQSFYAIISGFHSENVPGVGTFYDFTDRIPGVTSVSKTRLRILWRTAKDKLKSTTDKNADTKKHVDIARKLVARISKVTHKIKKQAERACPICWEFADEKYARYEVVLKAIFYVCFVAKSIDKGIIDLEKLFVAGDGTKLKTWSNPYGKRVCACEGRCDCKSQFTDFHARWGYDSYRECYVYGHSKYELTAYSLEHSIEVPLVIRMADCNRHDLILGISATREACEWLNFPVKVGAFDAAHDAIAFYQLGSERYNIAQVIPINPKNTGNFTYPQPIEVKDDGTPVCLNKKEMYYWGYCQDRMRNKWRCPLVCTKDSPDVSTCPYREQCSPSSYGRVIYTYPKTNYRLFTAIPRSSELFKKHCDKRTSAERSIKRQKYDFGLNQTRTATRERWFLRVMLAAMAQHLAAWWMLQEGKQSLPEVA